MYPTRMKKRTFFGNIPRIRKNKRICHHIYYYLMEWEKRTLMRTVFIKMKTYWKYKKENLRLKIRANVHFRIKISGKVIKILKNYCYSKKMLTISKVAANKKKDFWLKFKSILGFIRNCAEKKEKNQKMIKSISFLKYVCLTKSLKQWKDYKNVLNQKMIQKEWVKAYDLKRLKKFLFFCIKKACFLSKKIKETESKNLVLQK